MPTKFQFITELYRSTLTKLTGDYESWTGFLRAACYNYKCPFDEQVLIYAQRPNATAVLELEKWNRQFGRWVNAGATGIAVMDEAHGKGRLKHYFDITDTHVTRISRPVPIWTMEPAYTEPVIETLEATFGTLSEKDNLPDAILSASRNAVADNMQDYLRDLLDCRGGSMLEELDALNVEVTYQLVERKQKFIAQIMTSKSPVRSAEDVDEQALSYAEIKALASGNPLIKEKMDLDIEISKLKLLKGNHLSQRYALEDAISKTFPKSIAETQERLAGYGADIATVKAHTAPNADGFSPMTLAGKVYAEKKAAGTELLTLCQNMLTPEPMQIGLYRGLTLELSFDSFSQEYRLAMIGQLRHVVTLGTDVFGNIQRMDNLLESLPVKEQACREKLSDLHSQLETAKAEVLKPFPREEELKAKLLRLEELNALLNIDKREPEIVADAEAPEACEQPPARKTTDLER